MISLLLAACAPHPLSLRRHPPLKRGTRACSRKSRCRYPFNPPPPLLEGALVATSGGVHGAMTSQGDCSAPRNTRRLKRVWDMVRVIRALTRRDHACVLRTPYKGFVLGGEYHSPQATQHVHLLSPNYELRIKNPTPATRRWVFVVALVQHQRCREGKWAANIGHGVGGAHINAGLVKE